jgi:hypothetical protein
MKALPDIFDPWSAAGDLTAGAAVAAYSDTAYAALRAMADRADRAGADGHSIVWEVIDYFAGRPQGRVVLAAVAADQGEASDKGRRMLRVKYRARFNVATGSGRSIRRNQQGRRSADPAVAKAIAADGQVARADRDDNRRWSAIRTNDTAATGAAAWSGAIGGTREHTVNAGVGGKFGITPTGEIRIIREQSLETMLDQKMRIHHATADPAVAGDYDATLTAALSERTDRETWSRSFAAILPDLIERSPNAAIRTLPAYLADLVAATAAHTAQVAARADLVAAQDSGKVAAIKRADSAYRKATVAAKAAHRIAALAVQVYRMVRDGQTVTVADLVALSVYSEPVAAATKQTARQREVSDRSQWDRTAILTLVGLDPKANGRTARALSDAVFVAADQALQTAVSDSSLTVVPNLRTDHAADRRTYVAARNAGRAQVAATVR